MNCYGQQGPCVSRLGHRDHSPVSSRKGLGTIPGMRCAQRCGRFIVEGGQGHCQCLGLQDVACDFRTPDTPAPTQRKCLKAAPKSPVGRSPHTWPSCQENNAVIDAPLSPARSDLREVPSRCLPGILRTVALWLPAPAGQRKAQMWGVVGEEKMT